MGALRLRLELKLTLEISQWAGLPLLTKASMVRLKVSVIVFASALLFTRSFTVPTFYRHVLL